MFLYGLRSSPSETLRHSFPVSSAVALTVNQSLSELLRYFLFHFPIPHLLVARSLLYVFKPKESGKYPMGPP